MSKLYAVRNKEYIGVYTEEEFKNKELDKLNLSVRIFKQSEKKNARLWSKKRKLIKMPNPKKEKSYLKTRLFAVKNEEIKGVYTYEEYMSKNISNTPSLSKRTFSMDEMEMAIAWANGICVSQFVRNKKENSEEYKEKQLLQAIKTLRNVKKLLIEKNIVSGLYNDCKEPELKLNRITNIPPCPYDNRVIYGTSTSVSTGCYYKCGKNKNKILDNKDIYIKSIDTLISYIEKDPKWGNSFDNKQGTMSLEDVEILNKWDEEKEKQIEEEFKRYSALRDKYTIKFKGGCPEELFLDLKRLKETGIIDECPELYWKFTDKNCIYTYYYEGLREEVTITKDNAYIFIYFNPEAPSEGIEIKIGDGCISSVKTIQKEEFKTAINKFYYKWSKYRKDNPDKYIKSNLY